MTSIKNFHYNLPAELIAHYPTPQRTGSRLLCLDKDTGKLAHKQFIDLPQLLERGDLLVFNNTKVIPARLFGYKPTGGKVEILIERVLDHHRALVHLKASKSPQAGTHIILQDDVQAEVVQRHDDLFELKFLDERPLLEVLNKIGHIPLPPYIDRSDETLDEERYQTVYAKTPGAVAAPTAGLHFDDAMLKQLSQQGVDFTFVTLHVGAGTFQPVRVENIKDHVMHAEYAEIKEEVCQKIITARKNGKRVIAVGTTSVRCLESAAAPTGSIQPFAGETRLFIYPGYEFRCVDALITNFHLPQSTLLMLVCAFAGHKNAMSAYNEAIARSYRFFSYGDSMFIK